MNKPIYGSCGLGKTPKVIFSKPIIIKSWQDYKNWQKQFDGNYVLFDGNFILIENYKDMIKYIIKQERIKTIERTN